MSLKVSALVVYRVHLVRLTSKQKKRRNVTGCEHTLLDFPPARASKLRG